MASCQIPHEIATLDFQMILHVFPFLAEYTVASGNLLHGYETWSFIVDLPINDGDGQTDGQ